LSKSVDFAAAREEAGEEEAGLAVRLVGDELAVGVNDGGGGG